MMWKVRVVQLIDNTTPRPPDIKLRPEDVLIVIPTLSRPTYLFNTVTSLLASSTGNWHCVVVDNNGEENTSYVPEDNRITHFVPQKPLGFWQSMSLALTYFKHELVGYFGNDCLFFPHCIEDMLVCWNGQFPHNKGLMTVRDDMHNGYHAAHGFISRTFLEILYGSVRAPMYRHGYGDSELTQFARDLRRFRYCAQSHVEHLHPNSSTRTRDAVDDLGRESRRFDNLYYIDNYETWAEYKKFGAMLRLGKTWI